MNESARFGLKDPGDAAPGNGRGHDNGNGMVHGLTDFGNDVFTLAELQARLAALDLKACVEDIKVPLVAIVVSMVLTLGAVPVVLLGLASLLARGLGITDAWAMLMVSAGTLLWAGLLLGIFAGRFQRSFQTLRRSGEEFTRNVAWVRTVLLHSGRAPANRSR